MKNRVLVVAMLVSSMSAHAQEIARADAPASKPPRPVAPAGPLLQIAPEFSSWQIDFVTLEEESTGAPTPPVNRADEARRLRQIIATKTRKIVHEVSVYALGRRVDAWYNDKLEYEKKDGTTIWMAKSDLDASGARTDSGYMPFPSTGFRDLEWIDAKTYATTLPYGDRACLVFVRVNADQIGSGDLGKLKKLLDTQDTVAYIDAETRLPVSLRTGKTVRTYHFTAPPTEMQTFPPDLATQIKQGEDARTRVNTLAPRPY